MRFISTNKTHPLSFNIGDKHYDVEMGGTFDVPERFAYAVKLLGLPAEPTLDVNDPALEEATAPTPSVRSTRK